MSSVICDLSFLNVFPASTAVPFRKCSLIRNFDRDEIIRVAVGLRAQTEGRPWRGAALSFRSYMVSLQAAPGNDPWCAKVRRLISGRSGLSDSREPIRILAPGDHPNGQGMSYLSPYLHPYPPQFRLLGPCRTGLAIGSVIYAFRSLIVVTRDVFIACLGNCRSGYRTLRSLPSRR